jgi:hypothetical protein
MHPLLAAAIAAVVLFAIAAVVGWADLRHQARVARLNAQITRTGEIPTIARGRW